MATTSPRRRSRVRTVALVLVAVEVPLAVLLVVGRMGSSAQALEPGEHAFLSERADGAPVTWDPCSPIGYVVNWDHAPEGAVQLLAGAMDTVEEATGLTFTAVGATRLSPSSTSGTSGLPAGAEVLVGWVPAADEPRFDSGEAIGFAGPGTSGGPEGQAQYSRGRVSLDADWFADATPTQARAVLLHELGHLVGLGHVEDDTQLMSRENVGTEEFQQGDLDGLARLGPRGGPRCG